MFLPGQVVYFTPFYFQNGQSAPKDKYFIVLARENDELLIASLPTSINKAPSLISDKTHGCINHHDRLFNCYLFESNRCICDSGFSFPLRTYLYGNEIEIYELSILMSVYPIVNNNYRIEGTLSELEFSALLECLKSSNSVKRKIVRKLFR